MDGVQLNSDWGFILAKLSESFQLSESWALVIFATKNPASGALFSIFNF